MVHPKHRRPFSAPAPSRPPPHEDATTASSSSSALPSTSDADDALGLSSSSSTTARGDYSEVQWRSIVLRTLSYGTDYDAERRRRRGDANGGGGHSAAAGGGGDGGGGLKLKVRALKAAQYLSDALVRLDKTQQASSAAATSSSSAAATTKAKASGSANDGGGNDSNVAVPTIQDQARAVLTDALWLASNLVGPQEKKDGTAAAAPAATKAAASSEAASNDKNNESYQALLAMVQTLTTPTPPSSSSSVGPPLPISTVQASLDPTVLADAALLPPTAASAAAKKKQQTGAIGSSGGEQTMLRRLKKINTDLFYRQRKFNLLREESEGYAKLLTLLTTGLLFGGNDGDGGGGGAAAGAEGGGDEASGGGGAALGGGGGGGDTLTRVKELIGAFDLDPNRVLDVTLDVLEAEIHGALEDSPPSSSSKERNENDEDGGDEQNKLRRALESTASTHAPAIQTLLSVTRQFNRANAVPHLLGFKFASYNNASVSAADGGATTTMPKEDETKNDNDDDATTQTPPPTSLYVTTIVLALHGVLNMTDLAPHLRGVTPTSSSLKQLYHSYRKEKTARIKKLGSISLNASSDGGGENKEDGGEGASSLAASSSLARDPSIRLFVTGLELGLPWDESCALLTAVHGGEEKGNSTDDDDVVSMACCLSPDVAQAALKRVDETMRSTCSSSASSSSASCGEEMDTGGDEKETKDESGGAPSVSMLSPGASLVKRPPSTSASSSSPAASRSPAQRRQSDDAEREEGEEEVAVAPPSTPLPSSSSRSASANKSAADWLLAKKKNRKTTGATATTDVGAVAAAADQLRGPLKAVAESGAIGNDPVLYCALCRWFRSMLSSSSSSSGGGDVKGDEGADGSIEAATATSSSTTMVSGSVLDVLRTFLVPSLSLFTSNPAVASELWSVLCLLPYPVRYSLYGSWRYPGLEKGALRSLDPKAKPLPYVESEVKTGIAARYVLKRLSKDNIRDMGRQLSKVSHNNPLVVFTAVLNQIESYDNLILMMVETFKFVTVLGLDVMGYCLLSSLGGGEDGGQRSKLKMDGLSATQWLASLETFTGAFYKKFPEVELRGILANIAKSLQQGQVLELGVLRNLIKNAGGYGFADYESTASLSEVQLEGRSGSQMLKRETSSFGVVEKLNRKSSRRLRSVLQGDDMGVAMLILLAQIRHQILYSVTKSSPKHIKLIGNLYDTCQSVLALLLEFLTDCTEDQQLEGVGAIAKYAKSLPSLKELHQSYGLDAPVAWMLCRPLVRAAMFSADEKSASTKEDADAKDDSAAKIVRPHLAPFLPSSVAMRDTYRDMLPESAWSCITPILFEVFYSHSLYDIHCPEERYSLDVARLKKEMERLTQLKEGGQAARATMSALAAAAAAAGGSEAQIQQATAFSKVHEVELERVKRNAEILSFDFQRQKKHCAGVRNKLESLKDSMLSAIKADNAARTAQAFLMHCVYPRCFLSPEDASYCAHFVKLLHDMETPEFHTVQYFDVLVNAIAGALYCITEDEAGNMGILLNQTWKTVSEWRYNKEFYEKNVNGKPGSSMTSEACVVNVSYDEFKGLYNRWHAKLGAALVGCLKSSEYMHTRASLIVLSRVVQVYPTRPILGRKILAALTPLQGEDNPRPDIRATAQGYGSQLIKARDEGAWKEEDAAAIKERQEKERQETADRIKKAEKQQEEMIKESQDITRNLGDGWNRGRDERGRYPQRGPGPRVQYVEGGDRRAAAVRSPQLNPAAATFTPANGGTARELRSHAPRGGGGGFDPRDRPRDYDRDRERESTDHRRGSREREHHQDSRGHKWERDRGEGGPSGAAPGGGGRHQQDNRGGTRPGGRLSDAERGGSNLEGRWQRGVVASGDRDGERNSKRSRSPGREVYNAPSRTDGGDRDEREVKRMRTHPPHDRDRAGGSSTARGGPPPHDSRRGEGRDRRSASPARGERSQTGPAPRRPERRGGPRRSL